MAMSECRECKTPVSDEAKTCPKCGIATPVKKTSRLTVLFVCLAVVIAVAANMADTSTPTATSSSAAKSPAELQREALKSIQLDKFVWQKGGFSNVLLIDARISNKSLIDVKDLTIECNSFAKSGTPVGSTQAVLLERLKAGASLNIKGFNMGLLHSQAAGTECRVSRVVLM